MISYKGLDAFFQDFCPDRKNVVLLPLLHVEICKTCFMPRAVT